MDTLVVMAVGVEVKAPVGVRVGLLVGGPGVKVRVGVPVMVGVLVGPHPGNWTPVLLTVEQDPTLIGPIVVDIPRPSVTSK